jgi:hypothetical protein|tara:strand:- start:12835 stop:13443 length:609 start_codon:yes stop_codon:yes gene_type:complete
MDILYYSNYCTHSQKTVNTLVKGNLKDKISFICIDKRTQDPTTKRTHITLENGKKVLLPPNVHSVPTLLLVNENYRSIMGDDIVKHFHNDMKKKSVTFSKTASEPSGFELGGSVGGVNIMSEKYTMYNLTSDELSAKGNGGNRSMHNYVTTENDMLFIETPEDNYVADKISNDVTLDNIQQTRMDEINQVVPPTQPLGQHVK